MHRIPCRARHDPGEHSVEHVHTAGVGLRDVLRRRAVAADTRVRDRMAVARDVAMDGREVTHVELDTVDVRGRDGDRRRRTHAIRRRNKALDLSLPTHPDLRPANMASISVVATSPTIGTITDTSLLGIDRE